MTASLATIQEKLHEQPGRASASLADTPPGSGPLIARAYRPVVCLIAATALFGLITLATRVSHLGSALAVDQQVDERLIYRFRDLKGLFLTIVQLGSPTGVIILSLTLGLICLAAKNLRTAVFVTCGPPTAGALTEYVLKPLIDRTKEGGLAFPSGHTTGAVAVAIALAVMLLPGGVLAARSALIRGPLLALTLILVSAVPLGLVVLQYHYATDILGGFAVATLTVIAFAFALDGLRIRQHRPRQPA